MAGSEVPDIQVRARLFQRVGALFGHLGVADAECLELLQALEVGEAGVGQLGLAEVEDFLIAPFLPSKSCYPLGLSLLENVTV